MKIKSALIAVIAQAAVSGVCAASADTGDLDVNQLRAAVSNTTTRASGGIDQSSLSSEQQEQLVQWLAGAPSQKWKPGPICMWSCPPPFGSLSADPQRVNVPVSGTGSTTIHWTWDESHQYPIAEYACLWVTTPGNSQAYVVDCEHPGNRYTVYIPWIGQGSYNFFVALRQQSPAPVAGMPVLAATTVTGTR
ncbi:hypothetical protein [Burkholderia sp. MSMB1498]|uniref:hypothetical protein n=1 Tax=Burkholderia sp. MSMB1498 TaxID=1637842 RepID=UPI0007599C94|nr:hypothetical protein [Burkholderia sp. MSMB1498]KVK87277.1 hypothetical protein WS91_31460 [Burkholderia sp. MSMB1498]